MSDTQSLSPVAFATSADIPPYARRAVAGLESTGANAEPDFAAPQLAVTIGSQIASFGDDLSAGQKKSISNGFLFAQQVADKRMQDTPGATSADWYASYVDVLSRIGWNREDQAASLQQVSGTLGDVHKELLPIIKAALGPAATASALVSVLEGLQNMSEGSSWITLFNRTSQRASATQFQMSHTQVENGVPRINLVAFELTAEQTVTQALFFRLSTNDAALRKFETKMAIDEDIFDSVSPIIAERLKERAKDFILNIPLL